MHVNRFAEELAQRFDKPRMPRHSRKISLYVWAATRCAARRTSRAKPPGAELQDRLGVIA